MTSALLSVLAETEETKNATPEPVLLGLAAFGTLLLLLFLVSRFNKDR
jgi:hypothetical protein